MGIVVLAINADGTVRNDVGVLLDAQAVQVTRRLSRMGSFSISARASAANAGAVLAAGNRVRVLSDAGGSVQVVAEGRIRQVQQRLTADGGEVEAQGEDLLGELRERLVDGLLLAEDALFAPTYAEQHRAGDGTIAEIEAGTAVTLTVVSGDYLYIGYEERFDSYALAIDAPAPSGWTLATQYFRRDNAGYNGWETLTTTGGILAHGQMVISWTRPEDWVQSTHAGRGLFWVRVQITGSGDLILDSNNVRLRSWTGQTTGVIGAILAYAPAGWSVSGSYYSTPGRGILYQFDEETVLEALVRVAELTGEHFRLAATGRVIEWLRSEAADSGVFGVPATVDGARPEQFTVLGVDKTVHAPAGPTRLRPYGAGQGAARLTLARATWEPPAPIEIDTAGNWIVNPEAELWGERIEAAEAFSEIGGVDNGNSVAAANELAQTAYERFMQLAGTSVAVRVNGTRPTGAAPRPGDLVTLAGIRDANSDDPVWAWNWSGQLFVLERTDSLTADGGATMTLACNNNRFYPLTGNRLVAEALADVLRGQRRAQRIVATAVVGAYVQEG